ncbi:MAG: MBL fold metallo-hydrolase [Candidatus Limnocylindrales bacterium]|nr:MBL fold metallo-hydrolase [Candidatus Limnocylindrales bacterium]
MSSERATGGLRLDIVGAGPAYTNRPGASGAAYLVRDASTAVLLDLGQGSFPRLAGLLDPGTLDAILISHLHPDHFIDLVPLRHYLRWGPKHPRRVRVLGPAGLGERLDALNAEPGFIAAALDIEPLELGLTRVGSIAVDVAHVTHSAESCGFRLSIGNGPGIVYSGDCGRAADLDPLIRPGDDLLCEVSFGPGPVPSDAAHLDGPAVAALARRTGVCRVLLTHLLMGFDEGETVESVRRDFGGPVAFVQPGDHFTI